ncbi:MAG: hypothetical protein U0325_28550 [Polyangiales bacterium]
MLVSADGAGGFAIHSLPDGRRLGEVTTRIQGRPMLAGDVARPRGR